MLEKNSLTLGLILGILIPALGFAAILGIFELLDVLDLVSSKGFRPMFRERTSAIVGIAFNAIALNHYTKIRNDDTVRGIVVITTLLVVAWMAVFGKYVL